MTTISFTPAKYRKLKEAYDKAEIEGQDKFLFEGQVIVTGYARHLLKYLRDVLKIAQ